MVLGNFNARYGAFWSLGSQAILLLIGAIITNFVPNEKKRQEAFNDNKNSEEMRQLSNS